MISFNSSFFFFFLELEVEKNHLPGTTCSSGFSSSGASGL
jgi:hypothetical protein